MKVLFLNAPYAGKVFLCPETIDYLKKKNYQTVAIYASIQFSSHLDKVKKQLHQLGIKAISSQPFRTGMAGQLLGCDCNFDSLNLPGNEIDKIDAFLYLGDGRFHPLALVYGQKDQPEVKEVVCDNPVNKKMTVLGKSDIASLLRRYRASLMKFLSAQKIGVIISLKPGQEQYKMALKLEKKYSSKKFYYFVDDSVSYDQLENFPFINIWVNTACPRIGFDDPEKFRQGVINLNDAYIVESILSRDSVLNKI